MRTSFALFGTAAQAANNDQLGGIDIIYRPTTCCTRFIQHAIPLPRSFARSHLFVRVYTIRSSRVYNAVPQIAACTKNGTLPILCTFTQVLSHWSHLCHLSIRMGTNLLLVTHSLSLLDLPSLIITVMESILSCHVRNTMIVQHGQFLRCTHVRHVF